MLVLFALLVVVVAGIGIVGSMVSEALPKVPKDKAGDDSWDDPLAVRLDKSGLLMVILPNCAATPITRIVLWDANSNPYWEVSGSPTLVKDLILGAPPEGFNTDVAFKKPPAGATVRLVAFRRVGGPIGLRFRLSDLVEGRVMGGDPLTSYSLDGWKKASVCSSSSDSSTLATKDDN